MADPAKKETWIQWVALTTTILAVCAAISSLKASSYSTKVQLFTTQEANKWGHYQAKANRENSYRLNRDLLQVMKLDSKNPQVQRWVTDNLKRYEEEIGRYGREKEEIRKEAENIQAQQDLFQRHNGAFSLAVMILQIAIMMSAVGALIKKRRMWYLGMVMGVWGMVYMINGLFLLF